MLTRKEARITCEHGLEDDLRGTVKTPSGKENLRQVTLLSRQQWQAVCAELALELSWLTRRANLLYEGDQLFGPEYVGMRLKIGPSLLLEVTGETTACERMDQAHPGLREALTPYWRGGISCKVLEPGHIALKDEITLRF